MQQFAGLIQNKETIKQASKTEESKPLRRQDSSKQIARIFLAKKQGSYDQGSKEFRRQTGWRHIT